MKVLMTADTVGGVWTYSIELARALRPHGVEFVLATMGAPLSGDQWTEARALPNVEVAESAFRLEWMEEPWADVERAGAWLLELEARHAPDLVHLNGYAHGALAWTRPLLVVGHSCVLSWWRAVRGEDAPGEWDRYREAVSRGIRAARRVVAPSQAMLDALQMHYGPLPPAAAIPNARDVARFATGPKEPMILGVGRLWDEAKNVAALGRVAADLAWPVYLAGGRARPGGGASAELGHARALGRLGPDELAGWLSRAAVAAFPARYEPFGLAALEAGLSGCALVLGDIPSLREVWGDAALYVPPDDEAALRATLERLIGDEWLRATLAARARSRAQTYSPERLAARYLEVYGDLATRATPHKEDALCVS